MQTAKRWEPNGSAPAMPVRGHEDAAYLEAHIEQGPILETAQKTIGGGYGSPGPALV